MIPSMTSFYLLAKILCVIVCPISKFKQKIGEWFFFGGGEFPPIYAEKMLKKKKKILSKFLFFLWGKKESPKKNYFKKLPKFTTILPTICYAKGGAEGFLLPIFGI
jgi:hypothetical protein